MRMRAEVLVLLLIVAFLAAMIALSNREDIGTADSLRIQSVRSSYRTLPEGYKALYLALGKLGYTPRRLTRPYALLPKRGLLIVVDPFRQPVTQYERRKLADWLADGNYACLIAEFHPANLLPVPGLTPEDQEEFLRELGINLGGPVATKTPSQVIAAGKRADTATPLAPSFLAERAPLLRVKTKFRLPTDRSVPITIEDRTYGLAPLYRDSQGVVVAYSQVGKGGIVWCTSPWSFSNEGIAEAQNLDFVLALADLNPKAPILFDEYHHGFGAGMSLWTVAPPLTKLGIVQVGLALLLLLVTLAWRFGPMRLPVEERFTRSRAEYLTSMAGLLERVHASHVAVLRLRLRLVRQLSRRLGLAANSSLLRLREANEQIGVVDQALLTQICRQLDALDSVPRPDEVLLLQLAQQIERLLAVKKG